MKERDRKSGARQKGVTDDSRTCESKIRMYLSWEALTDAWPALKLYYTVGCIIGMPMPPGSDETVHDVT